MDRLKIKHVLFNFLVVRSARLAVQPEHAFQQHPALLERFEIGDDGAQVRYLGIL